MIDYLIYPERPKFDFHDTMFAYREVLAAGYWCVRVESDPLGSVNKIVRLLDGRNSIKAALCRIPVDATVTLIHDEGGYTIDEVFALKDNWRYRLHADRPYFTPTPPAMPVRHEPGWRVEVDGRTVLSVTDAELREPYVPPPPPPLRRRMRAALGEQVRDDADAIARRFGFHRDDECRDWG